MLAASNTETQEKREVGDNRGEKFEEEWGGGGEKPRNALAELPASWMTHSYLCAPEEHEMNPTLWRETGRTTPFPVLLFFCYGNWVFSGLLAYHLYHTKDFFLGGAQLWGGTTLVSTVYQFFFCLKQFLCTCVLKGFFLLIHDFILLYKYQ